jgi:hypothetical protein
MKVAIAEKEKFKRRLNAIESLMGKEKSKEKESGSFINPISVSLTTILAIVIFGVNRR